MAGKPILITGGGGFLGRHIVQRLLERGDAVRVMGRRPYPDLVKKGVDCRLGDVADAQAALEAARGCGAIVHAAAIPGLWGRYALYDAANHLGTRNILAAARAHGIARLVHTSTPSVVHGGKDIEGGDESLPYPARHSNPYAATKALAEQLVLRANSPDLATLAIRPHLMFGPGDTQLIPKLLERAATGRLRRVGDGRNLVSVAHVGNVADAHIAALDRLEPGSPAAGQVYFVNEPEPVNCWDFINRILTAAGLPPVSRSVSFRTAYAAGWLLEKTYSLLGREDDPPMTRFLAEQLATSHWFRVDKARRELDWTPKASIEEGIREAVRNNDPWSL